MSESFHFELREKASSLPLDRSPAEPSEEEQLPMWHTYLQRRIQAFLDNGKGDELVLLMPSVFVAEQTVKHCCECCEEAGLHISNVANEIRVVIVR